MGNDRDINSDAPRRATEVACRGRALAVVVDDRGLEPALRAFRKLVQKEGLLKDLKRRAHYVKPGERRRRKIREAVRRRRRQEARARARYG